MIDTGLYLSYGLVIVAVIGAFIVPPVLAFVNGNTKGLIKGAIGFGIILLIFLISYAISGDEVTRVYEVANVDAEGSKKIGGALIMTYILLIVSFLTMTFTEVSRFFK